MVVREERKEGREGEREKVRGKICKKVKKR